MSVIITEATSQGCDGMQHDRCRELGTVWARGVPHCSVWSLLALAMEVLRAGTGDRSHACCGSKDFHGGAPSVPSTVPSGLEGYNDNWTQEGIKERGYLQSSQIGHRVQRSMTVPKVAEFGDKESGFELSLA